MKNKLHPFPLFLKEFTTIAQQKENLCHKAFWVLETTGSADASDLKAALDNEYRLLYHDRNTYEQLCKWDQDPTISDPILKRQLNVLIRAFKENMMPKEILGKITTQDAAIAHSFSNFRAELEGKKVSDNAIKEILKKENNSDLRKKAWNASKNIGQVLAPQILSLVELRNQAAKSLGYPNYFLMQLDLHEVEEKWLFDTFDEAASKSEKAYLETLAFIEKQQCERFQVTPKELGPWAWAEPFCQEDPLNNQNLDHLVTNVDIEKLSLSFYQKMGFDLKPVFEKSDMYEREGKNQHAFCISMDRYQDVRMLNNVKPTLKWLETLLHEIGHAVYDLNYGKDLPWLLRTPAHTLTTEAMALIAGRQAYRPEALHQLIPQADKNLLKEAGQSLKRRQLIFSRWVMVMTNFEKELYHTPQQDLSALWWNLVKHYQKITPPSGRENKWDWATKNHIATSPVYYYSYLLGEFLASSIQELLLSKTGSMNLDSLKAGKILTESLFNKANSKKWSELIVDMTGESLSPKAWLKEFSGKE